MKKDFKYPLKKYNCQNITLKLKKVMLNPQ